MRFRDIVNESPESCPHCGGPMFSEMVMMEKKDACYYKVKASAKVWPSAYASGRLVQCRKKGAANYGNKSESMEEGGGAQQAAIAIAKRESGKYNKDGDRIHEESDSKCPPATQDITLNLKNRQKAIDEYGYGPLNPDMPNRKFWMAKQDEWNLDSPEEAKSSLCGNCAAFDQRRDTLDCIAQGIGSDQGADDPTIDAGDLGYCRFLKFKCASRRTCDAWVTGGPLRDKEPEAQEPLSEKWSQKYKGSINCSHPKGFSQKAHCAGKNKHNESVEMEMTCEDCGMCETHGDHSRDTLDEACWKGYHKEGNKELFGKRVPNCVKNTNEDQEMNMDELSRILELGTGLSTQARAELHEEFDLIESIIETIAEHNGVDSEVLWEDLETLTEDELYVFAVTSQPIMESEAWQKANKRDKTDGMSQKAVNTYRREHPGSKLKTAVTTKPSKLKKGSKASKRRKSYCSRSRGQMKMHSISCAKTPDKAICKARRRWNC
ncbi:DUF6321 domain-containing protein [Haliscomenobacter sp.]|uniref:DUF6321 domain-containing protein n=1 Tax=Haliscomenobacter sp. TaxID=2717303 RepID=UPI0033651BC5